MGWIQRIAITTFPPAPALAIAALMLSGCGPGAGPTVSLVSDDPAGRIPAMKAAAQRKDASAVPKLIEFLGSDDPAERLYAIEALRRITGKTMGYTYYGAPEERQAAIERWKVSIGAATQPAPAASQPTTKQN